LSTDIDITDRLIDEIQGAKATELFEIDGLKYYSRDLRLPPAEMRPDALDLHTLAGIVDFLKADVDVLADSRIAIQVVNHAVVHIIGPITGRYKQRDVFAKATCEHLFGHSFRFGQYYSAEDFNIAIQSLFVETPGRAIVLKLAGNLSDEAVTNASDDGVTQMVATKRGVHLVGRENVPNPVYLAPFRTFREISQPESPFIFRVKKGDIGCLPTMALFEADGGTWKLKAIESIREWFSNREGIEGIPIIA
jgi:hypothetical protein